MNWVHVRRGDAVRVQPAEGHEEADANQVIEELPTPRIQ
jgi:hypothetical protein